uniref:Putative head-tail connector n=1 Tax=viral metagenome TaxID=1070528 RepID=A0A6M3XWV5_9ZZZZ
MIVDLEDVLSFLDVDVGYFVVNASHDVLVLTYDAGSATNVEVTDGTYTGAELAAHLKTKIDTAFTITSTVSYSTTTKKFTIAVEAAHTIAFTASGSDAGLLFGFNTDHAAAVSITSNIAASDPSAIISVIHGSVEDWVENYCQRKFEAALYVKERHDGDGQNKIYFEQYPVLAVNLDDLVWNSTAKTVTRADGGSFVDDGFVAGDKVLVQNSDSNSGLLTIAAGGVAALTLTFSDSITSDTSDDDVILSHFRELWIGGSEIDEDDYEVFDDHIYYSGGFYRGHGNIRFTYYAGYSASNMPDDLQMAIKIIVKYMYQKRQEEVFGVGSYSIGDIQVTSEGGIVNPTVIPKEAEAILEKYRKWEIV